MSSQKLISRNQLLLLIVSTALIQFTSQAQATIDFEEVSLLEPNETPAPPSTSSSGGGSSEQPAESKQEAALKQAERLTVIAPKYLRPNSDYHVLINLANSRVPATIDLQLIGARDSNREQTEAKSVLANSDETQTVKFTIGDWPAAEYVLSVNAQAIDRSWNFTDERQLVHQAKSFSGFVQTDKAIYKAGQAVQFRVLLLTDTLRPLSIKDGINVTVQDPQRNIIKQWLGLSNYRGLLSLDMPLTDDPILGDYTIKVETRGQEFGKQFTVAEYVLPTFDVSVQLPKYATYNESDIVASVKATYTYGKPVQGHATLTVQPLVRFAQIDARPLQQAQFRARLSPEGSADFRVDVLRDLRQQGDLFERDVEFFALVEEDLTGRKYNGTQTLRIYADNIKIERLDAQETFKPGMRHLFRYKVSYQDDIPVEENGQEVTLNYKALGELIKSVRLQPRQGLVEHELQVPAKVSSPQSNEHLIVPDQLQVEAKFRGQTHHLEPVNAYQSQSQQYLQIQVPKLRGHIGSAPASSLSVRVETTEPVQHVTCQGFSRGDIVWALSKGLANKTELHFELSLEPRMAPVMRIICFYVRPQNKELIADSVSVPVGGLSKNLVRLAPSRDEVKPGQEVEVGVVTRPNSLVGVLAVDQSVLLLKSGNDLSEREILDDIKSYGSSSSHGSDGSSSAPLVKRRMWWPFSRSSMRNTESLFESADVVVMSNNLIYNGAAGLRLGHPLSNPNILQYSMAGSSLGPVNRISLDSLILEHKLEPPAFHLANKGADQAPPIRLRTQFPETWLWQNGTADANGLARFSSKVPDTITSWQVSAFSLSESHGLALSLEPASIRVFRPFFIKLNLPYSIIRGETVSIQAIVFNYSKRPLSAKVTLDNRARQFEFVEAANTIEDERHSSASSESRVVNIAPQEGASVSFLVQPKRLGQLDVRVIAQSDAFGDALVKKLLVKPEGQVQHMNKAMLIQLLAPDDGGQGAGRHSPRAATEARLWRRNVTIEVPANAVEGSQKVFVSAIGDILGAGLANVDDLLRLPYGCGEQNMINLVPNIVIHNYLSNTNRLRDSQRQRAVRNIETGYQRQLGYKRNDGSFSAFGQSDQNGSVWLTAYVLKSLQQAKSIVTVDETVLQQAAQFIGSLSRPDGSIAEVGMLHNKALASHHLAEPGSKGGPSIYLTAYAMVALLQTRPATGGAEKGRQPSDPSDPSDPRDPSDLSEVLEKGLDFLEGRLSASGENSELSNYELAIIAYTMQLAGATRQAAADRAYEQLWSRASHNQAGDQIWWSNETPAPPPPPPNTSNNAEVGDESENVSATGNSDTLSAGERETGPLESGSAGSRRTSSARLSGSSPQPPLKPVRVKGDQSAHLFIPESLSVEQTAWALLTAIRRQELERALPIVRWLVAQQNSRGGFASTQDTVLAIEALASYAEASALATGARSRPLSLDVEFVYPRPATAASGSSSSSSSLRRTSLDQLLVRQSNALVQQQTRLPDNITWVQVQASGVGSGVVQVSWQYNLLVSAERPAFHLNPTLDARSNTNYLQLSVCTFYKGANGTSAGGVSNMAVLEVELPSGYVADVETLSSLRRHKQIKRMDTEEGETRVLIYLERVTRDELCFTVPAHRSTKVSNNRPVPVTIYDYYDRKQAARIFYEPKLASSCDICEPGTCSDLCARKPVRAARLMSLHEQRRLAAARDSEARGADNNNNNNNNNNKPADETTSARPRTSSRLVESPAGTSNNGTKLELTREAAAYLPLASAFMTLVGVLGHAA